MEATTQVSDTLVDEPALMIARQPIYNNQMGVYGYELLFRSSSENARSASPAEATAHVLTTALLSFGLAELVYNREAIINITRAFIDVMPQVQLSPEQVTLDVPDNVRVDDALIESLTILKKLGYRLSIGGFGSLRESRLLAIADHFRVDAHHP